VFDAEKMQKDSGKNYLKKEKKKKGKRI